MKKVFFIVSTVSLFTPVFSVKKDHKVKRKIDLNKEIEVKIRPIHNQLTFLKKWLKEKADYKGKKQQKDIYVDNPKKSFTFKSSHGFLDAHEKLRVRFEKGSEKVCYKYRHTSTKGKTLSCDEYQCDVNNQKGFHKILRLIGFGHIEPNEALDGERILDFFKKLGFTKHEVVEKMREKYVYDDCEIVIDEVKGLGVFVEVELKSHEQDVSKGLTKIYQLLKKIGFKKIVQFDRSYLHMLWNPDYDFSEKINIDII